MLPDPRLTLALLARTYRTTALIRSHAPSGNRQLRSSDLAVHHALVDTLPDHHAIGSSRHYQRHQPENTPLYPIVERHLSTLRDELQRHEAPLPHFGVTEFQDYVRCGRLEYGFVRVKCNGCPHEHLVAFSCKRRGFCPSCGARRMIETSAHLVDHVIPEVPVRQWVLSFP
jgi:ribosomal protein S27E